MIEILRILATENTAIGFSRWHGSPRAPSKTSAKGSPVSPRPIASIFEIVDGRVTDYRVLLDAIDLFTQLAR